MAFGSPTCAYLVLVALLSSIWNPWPPSEYYIPHPEEPTWGVPAAGMGLVYVFRPASSGNALETWTFADDQLIGVSRQRGYYFAQLAEGTYDLWSKTEAPFHHLKRNFPISVVELSVEEGKTYFFKLAMRPSGMMSRFELVRIDESRAEKYFRKCTFCEPTVEGRRVAGIMVEQTRQASTADVPTEARHDDRPNVKQITVGATHSCALLADGTVLCWGGNGSAQIADVDSEVILEPTGIEMLDEVVGISAGAGFTCGVTRGGQVRCWGHGSDGQLGNGERPARSGPVAVHDVSSAVEVASGWAHACARLADGAVQCWGNNELGQLGDGTEGGSSVPRPVRGVSGVTSISCGTAHTCVVDGHGAVYCWGTDGFGGGEPTIDSPTPVRIEGVATASDVACGRNHTCVLLHDGTVRCWGSNLLSQIGVKSPRSPVREPAKVRGVEAASQLSAALFHSCIVRGDRCECWGSNLAANLGRRPSSSWSWKARPVDKIGAGVASVATGGATSCALTSDGRVFCWGSNESGQLGLDVRRVPFSETPLRIVLPAGASR
jgi:alpha-tubulin suppressor-like RCC1 family protein